MYTCTEYIKITYYGRKKYPDPPFINTDNIHLSRRNFQRSSTLDWYCLRYICTVWLIEWYDYWHINNNLWIIITIYLKFTQ